MFTYVCCRCSNCTAQIILEEQNSDAFRRLPRPRAGREACPYRRAVFVPETYYVTESGTPLLERA